MDSPLIFISLICEGFSALVENSQQMLSEIQSSLKNVSDIPTMIQDEQELYVDSPCDCEGLDPFRDDPVDPENIPYKQHNIEDSVCKTQCQDEVRIECENMQKIQ